MLEKSTHLCIYRWVKCNTWWKGNWGNSGKRAAIWVHWWEQQSPETENSETARKAIRMTRVNQPAWHPRPQVNWSMSAVGPGTPNQQPLRCPHPHHLAFTVAEPANLITDEEELPVWFQSLCPLHHLPSWWSFCLRGSQIQGMERAHHPGDDKGSSTGYDPGGTKKLQQRHSQSHLLQRRWGL